MRDLEIRCSTELDFNHDDESFNPTALTLGDEGIISYNNGKLFQHITDGTQSEIIDLEPYFVQESTNVKNEVCTGMLGISGGRVVISFKSGLLICVEINVNTAEIVGNLAVGLEGTYHEFFRETFFPVNVKSLSQIFDFFQINFTNSLFKEHGKVQTTNY